LLVIENCSILALLGKDCPERTVTVMPFWVDMLVIRKSQAFGLGIAGIKDPNVKPHVSRAKQHPCYDSPTHNEPPIG
jgi:hypothetical protein